MSQDCRECCEDGEVAVLRSRIATMEAQVEQAREALAEDVKECAAWCDVDEGCLVCYQSDTCKKLAALAALKEAPDACL